MAGEQFDGAGTIRKFVPKNSQAFCDGMRHRSQGTAVGFPITDNPEDGVGSDFETAWDAGWNAAHAQAGGAINSDEAECCDLNGATISA